MKPLTLKNISTLLWKSYKETYINENGRVARPLDEEDTVSEGQAYAMLLSVWMNDRPVFEKCLKWTRENLSRREKKGDYLLAWHWSKGRVTDWNSASDADLDYALSLLLAFKRWGDEGYEQEYVNVMRNILSEETVRGSDGFLYLLPGTWGKLEDGSFITNPSYYSPAWFRLFFEQTHDYRWMELLEGSYRTIEKISMQLGKESGVGIIPDWCKVMANFSIEPAPEMSSLYSWDAIRVVWRLGIDWTWFREERAKNYVGEILKKFYEKEWLKNNGALFMEYNYSGTPYSDQENPISYLAAAFAASVGKDTSLSKKFLKKANTYLILEEDSAFFGKKEDYYTNSLSLLLLTLLSGTAKSF